jgi:hypothetical protein
MYPLSTVLRHLWATLRGVNISEWARLQGISARTARRRFHSGKLGDRARQLASGRIEVDASAADCNGACVAHIHASCLVDAVLAELGKRGYELDSTGLARHHEGRRQKGPVARLRT